MVCAVAGGVEPLELVADSGSRGAAPLVVSSASIRASSSVTSTIFMHAATAPSSSVATDGESSPRAVASTMASAAGRRARRSARSFRTSASGLRPAPSRRPPAGTSPAESPATGQPSPQRPRARFGASCTFAISHAHQSVSTSTTRAFGASGDARAWLDPVTSLALSRAIPTRTSSCSIRNMAGWTGDARHCRLTRDHVQDDHHPRAARGPDPVRLRGAGARPTRRVTTAASVRATPLPRARSRRRPTRTDAGCRATSYPPS